MAKVARGRLDGLHGMGSFTAADLARCAADLEARSADSASPDAPGWLLRRARRVRQVADRKERAREHKRRSRS